MERKEYYKDHQILFPINNTVILYFNMTVEHIRIRSEQPRQQVTTSNKTHGFKISHCFTKPQPQHASQVDKLDHYVCYFYSVCVYCILQLRQQIDRKGE